MDDQPLFYSPHPTVSLFLQEEASSMSKRKLHSSLLFMKLIIHEVKLQTRNIDVQELQGSCKIEGYFCMQLAPRILTALL